MKGIILNNFRLASKGALIAQLIFGVVFYIAAIVTPIPAPNTPLLSMFVFINSILCIVPILSTIQEEVRTQWLQQQIIMPVRRKIILQGKYISLLISIISTCLLMFLLCLLYVSIVPGSVTFLYVIQAIAQGASIALLASGIHFMIAYSFAYGKSEMFILLSIGIAVVFIQIYMAAILRISTAYFLPQALNCLCVSGGIFLISYFVVKKMLYHREL